ncbi:unnamed protein product [Rotaria sp. Silwood1]|nr:unnamed protein product [Rotaria sp. Silwood1]CAF3576400.1 unnamed protein product [Rotaria sp. Silwood1]CAF4522163.1 unnamed protein product [Rotaria sp. Silwood1]
MSTNEFDENTISFYINEPPINQDIEIFFANYASISPSALRDHLVSVREAAWQRHNYSHLGRWRFLDFSIKQNPIYEEILKQCKNKGATVIDFGCCLGQDIRQLIYDGVPLDRIRGYELDPFFIEQGYELFRDGELMKANKIFTMGDIFDDQFLKTIEAADYLYAGSFLHLFDAETQKDVCRRLSRLAKRAIAGRQLNSIREQSVSEFQCIVISLKEQFYSHADALVGIYPEPGDCITSHCLTLDLNQLDERENIANTRS